MKKKLTVIQIVDFLLLSIIGTMVFMSIIALVALHWALAIGYNFTFSPIGFETYLGAYGKFNALFTATLGALGAYFAFYQVKSAVNAFKDKQKSDRFAEWKTNLEIRLKEVEEFEPFMGRQFVKLRLKLFEDLFRFDFQIKSKKDLFTVLDTHFSDEIAFLERNKMFNRVGGIYPNNEHAFAYQNFQFIFLGCLDDYYDGMEDDLKEIYLSMLPVGRIVNNEAYVQAVNRMPTVV